MPRHRRCVGILSRPPRGLSLIETLITLLVLSIGLLAFHRVQTWLWLGADLARQRADALRLADEDLEQLRNFSRVDAASGQAAWADIAAQSAVDVTDRSPGSNYRVSRSVAATTQPRLKTVTTTVQWDDRHGEAQELRLSTAVAALDPRISGWLLLAPDAAGHPAPQGRHPAIPLTARDLGDGRSAYKPRADLTTTWVFDNLTGRIRSQCDSPVGLANADLSLGVLSGCTTVDAYWLSGQVRFATQSSTLTSADAERPTSPALDLDLRFTLSSTGHPSPAWTCIDDAPSSPGSQTVVSFGCIVRPAGTPPRWSGRLDIVPVGWTIATSGAGNYRVCRYSADHDGNGRIDNPEHPTRYSAVEGALLHQNFLVIQADASCPVESPVTLSDDSTAAHQP